MFKQRGVQFLILLTSILTGSTCATTKQDNGECALPAKEHDGAELKMCYRNPANTQPGYQECVYAGVYTYEEVLYECFFAVETFDCKHYSYAREPKCEVYDGGR